ncbi:sulfatase [Haloplanus halophilus]|uniref:sulfatase n=1 Tax=Haloplanus halophilus TaxID=2949993 RepID=UPI00204006A0|nr:sulfatase [Haloplanus sp. GDY1]
MEHPNILCISIDSLRSDFTSFMSDSDENTTPFLNSLSSQSTIYDNTISPSTWTLPVHTSIFTGLFPPEHGVETGEDILGEYPTFAQILSKNGYETKAFYKNGWLATGEILRGFKQVSDSASRSENSERSRKGQFAEAVGEFSPKSEFILKETWDTTTQFLNWKSIFADSLQSDKGGQKTIDRAISATDSINEPFCWFIHLNDAHWKYAPPAPHHTTFSERSDLSLLYNYALWQSRIYGSRTNRLKVAAGDIEPPERQVETFKNLYRGGIRYCDTLIEELVNSLKSRGIWEDTILIVFGDHGDGFGEDGIFGHHFSVHNSVIKVPLLIRDPTGRLENKRISSPTSLIDIYPTVLGFIGESGRSPNAIDLAQDQRDFTYTYYDISNQDYYTEAPKKGIELERLPPAKQYVIYGGKEQKGVQYPDQEKFIKIGNSNDSLESKLNSHTKSLTEVQTREGSLGADVEQQLEDLGYLRE